LLPALSLALVTSIIGYLTPALTPFPGLRQMAIFSVVGLIFAWLTVIFWFPQLTGFGSTKRLPLIESYVGLAHWPSFGVHRSYVVISAIVLVVASIGLSRLEVLDDIRALNNSPKNLIDDQIRLGKLLDAPAPAQFYLVRGATAELVLQREEKLKQRLDPLIEKKSITGYQAISNWVPSLELQRIRRQLIEEKLLNQNGPLLKLAARLGENAEWESQTRGRLLELTAPLQPEEFLETKISEPFRHLWIGRVGSEYASIVALRGLTPTGLLELKQAAVGVDGAQWVDKVAEISSVLARYRKYISLLLPVSYLAVYLLLYPRYGVSAWRLLAATALASILTLAVMGFMGQKLQLFHVLAFMLILGIGVDYSIFLHEEPGRATDRSWLAVTLSALSTLLSFGLLSLSNTPALHAFGFTMLIGTAIVWLITPYWRSLQ
jgi:predicted exporter